MKWKKRLWMKLGLAAIISLFILVIATYIGISFYFKDHYYCNTIIGGEDFSFKTPIEAEEALYSRLDHYALEVLGREDLSDIIMPEEIDMRFLMDDTLIKIKRGQEPKLWLLSLFRKYDYEFPWHVKYDEDALEKRMNKLAFFQAKNIRKPNDAYLTYSEEEKEYIIVEADPGTEVLKGKTEEAVKEALDVLEPQLDLEEKGCYKEAEIEKKDGNDRLINIRDQANKYVKAKVVYDWNGNEVIVDEDIIHEWIIIDKSKVTLDEDKIKDFVAEQAKKYDTYGKNRIFHTTDGREIELKSGAYGWKTDKESEREELIKALKRGETIEKEPIYSYTAAQPGQKDIGDTYVEIDLGSQHLYLYIEGELILESDFVSGNAARGWNTPAGVFGLTYKTRDAVLRGDNYATPVTYWMPFNGNIGMHDATWRGSFGGDIYLTNGSHGCINLPFENAKIIYEYVYTGFPVVCYY